MFECYNLLCPWNEELQFFEVNLQQGSLKILWLLLQVLILLFFEKFTLPTMSKTTNFGKKNTRNFRG